MASDNLFDRLGSVLKDYIDDEDLQRKNRTKADAKDTDRAETRSEGKTRSRENHSGQRGRPGQKSRTRGIVYKALPAALIEDFTILGLSPDADFQTCKKRYKKLLHLYHPDKYETGTPEQEKANALTMRIHQAFKNIEGYFIQYRSADETTNQQPRHERRGMLFS